MELLMSKPAKTTVFFEIISHKQSQNKVLSDRIPRVEVGLCST